MCRPKLGVELQRTHRYSRSLSGLRVGGDGTGSCGLQDWGQAGYPRECKRGVRGRGGEDTVACAAWASGLVDERGQMELGVRRW